MAYTEFSRFGTLAGMPLYLAETGGGALVLVLEHIGPRGGDYTKRIPIGNPQVTRWLIDALLEWLTLRGGEIGEELKRLADQEPSFIAEIH